MTRPLERVYPVLSSSKPWSSRCTTASRRFRSPSYRCLVVEQNSEPAQRPAADRADAADRHVQAPADVGVARRVRLEQLPLATCSAVTAYAAGRSTERRRASRPGRRSRLGRAPRPVRGSLLAVRLDAHSAAVVASQPARPSPQGTHRSRGASLLSLGSAPDQDDEGSSLEHREVSNRDGFTEGVGWRRSKSRGASNGGGPS
jgi:hypothetical protein